jgi:cytochrome c-type biogenesis protein CcmH
VKAVLVTLLAALAFAAPALAQEASLPDIEDEVMCAQCGTALNLSQSKVADDQREFIRDQIALGKTKEQIKAGLVDRYGPGVLALPEEEGFNLAVYLLPAVLAVLGLAGIGLTASRWRRARRPDAGPPSAGPGLDPADERRLDAELAAFDR